MSVPASEIEAPRRIARFTELLGYGTTVLFAVAAAAWVVVAVTMLLVVPLLNGDQAIIDRWTVALEYAVELTFLPSIAGGIGFLWWLRRAVREANASGASIRFPRAAFLGLWVAESFDLTARTAIHGLHDHFAAKIPVLGEVIIRASKIATLAAVLFFVLGLVTVTIEVPSLEPWDLIATGFALALSLAAATGLNGVIVVRLTRRAAHPG